MGLSDLLHGCSNKTVAILSQSCVFNFVTILLQQVCFNDISLVMWIQIIVCLSEETNLPYLMLGRISVKWDKMFRVNTASYFDRHSQRPSCMRDVKSNSHYIVITE